jgi:Methyltransferase domain
MHGGRGHFMDRLDKLLFAIDRKSRILEIGPSYNPAAPKAAGWQTYVVDHASQAELRAKYADHHVPCDKIEPVDFIWTEGPVHDAVPTDLHGRFNACIASHVIEHIPNPIAFFRSLDLLLAQEGVVSLAVPDKRYCFDFFRPLTLAPAWIEAFERGSNRHSRRNLLEYFAYQAYNGKRFVWDQYDDVNLRLPGELGWAKTNAYAGGMSDLDPYVDCHAWCFTPSSFSLLILELNHMGLIGFRVDRLFQTAGCEFIASLRKGEEKVGAQIQSKRLDLLQAVSREVGHQSQQMKLSRQLMAKIEHAFPVRRGLRKIGNIISDRSRKSFRT